MEKAHIILEIFAACLTLAIGIHKLIQFMKFRRNASDLHPFFSLKEVKKYTKYYIPAYGQNLAPSREAELIDAIFATKENLLDLFTKRSFRHNDEDNKYYIILADSGMGKTALLLNLYLKYKKQINPDYEIKFYPLGYAGFDDEIAGYSDYQKKQTILLLDAFDEDPKAIKNYKERLANILDLTYKFRFVIITSRTQFFPNQHEEPFETGVLKFGTDKGTYIFRKFYISPFDLDEISRYLRKKFPFYLFNINSLKKRTVAKQIVSKSKFLMVRPLLLSYIDDILSDLKFGNFFHSNQNSNFQYSFEIYASLIDKWISREANIKKEKQIRIAYKEDLHKFSWQLALEIYENGDRDKWLKIDPDKIEFLGKKFGVNLSDLELKSRSLLNRDSTGLYKFSHKSIMEYFLALELHKNPSFRNSFNYIEMDQAKMFLNEIRFAETLKSKFNIKTSEFNFQVKFKGAHQKRIDSLSESILRNLPFNMDLEGIDARHLEIKNTDFFEVFDNIQFLNLSENNISRIKILCMFNLQNLYLKGNRIESIERLVLPKLRILDVSGSKLSSYAFLDDLPSLQEIYLLNCQIDHHTANKLNDQYPHIRFHFDKSVKIADEKPYYEILIKENMQKGLLLSNFPRYRL